ncbi:hypothetical protein E2A64_17665 [Pseudohoeflea suaedae]|uniref:Ribbon-helix-helix domain-containing protein n=1 Tax=Pseudohoeflea suaedae TaxID=877384 RepID=A0A4R5PIU7_9HYPH|nr:ribbon-helix-helix domain-containing protein [Pseudohoeflea suaedae]TDH34485.1 hypothetical protein E2A64_17665 [Pseudohoeflea suaedae]
MPMTRQPMVEAFLSARDPDPSEPFFRAITTEGKRKALRLERGFWRALDKAAEDLNVSLGELIHAIDSIDDRQMNLASSLRVFAVEWLQRKVVDYQTSTSGPALDALIASCPSPAFVLTAQKQIRHTNPAFLRLLRMSFSGMDPTGDGHQLKLQLDMSVDEVVETLTSGSRSLSVGYILGFRDRRVRGTINAVLAPTLPERMIIGFVTA